MSNYIKKLLRENLINQVPAKRKQIKQLSYLIEKKIHVGDNITKKLNRINTPLSKNVLNFINSDKIKDDADVDYVDYDKDNGKLFTIGYTDQRGNSKKRLIKFNKLLTYLGGSIDNIKSYEVEELMHHLKQADLDSFKIVQGEDILWAYHCDNYDEGETMGSCMRHDRAQKYLELYTRNPNQVKCLVLVNPENNMVRGRALLWTMDDGDVYMDRRYVTNNQYNAEFNTYAEEHNFTTTADSDVSLEDYGDFDYYPYMDTFEFFNPNNGVLSASNYDDDNIKLTDTNGQSTQPGNYSEHYQEYIPDEESAYIDHMDDWVYDTDVEQDYKGNWVFRDSDDVVMITYGEHRGAYALEEDTITLYNNYICVSDEAMYIDIGEHQHEYGHYDDMIQDINDSDILTDEAVELTMGTNAGGYGHEDDCYVILDPNTGDEIGIAHLDDLDEFEDEYKYREYEA